MTISQRSLRKSRRAHYILRDFLTLLFQALLRLRVEHGTTLPTGDNTFKTISDLREKSRANKSFDPVNETKLEKHPFGNAFNCINLKAASEPGHGDDVTYKEYPELYDLLPRGALFLVNKETGYAIFLARGLLKFTAMAQGDDDDAELAKADIQFNMECIYIEVTTKANGENAQISLFQTGRLLYWIIGSKHSKIVLPFDYTAKDVEQFEQSRGFHVAGRAARAWLDHKQNVTADLVDVLKARTLQFELEDPQSMHLEFFDELRLVAITLIDNDSGVELDNEELFKELARSLNLHTVFDDVSSLKGITLAKAVEYCRNLLGKEGYVITYEGKRYKVKTHWYVFWRAVRQRTIKLWKKGATLDSVVQSMKDRLVELRKYNVLPSQLIDSRLNSVAELFIRYCHKMVFPIVNNREEFFAQYPIHMKNFFEFCDGQIADDITMVSEQVFQQLLNKINDAAAPKKNCYIVLSGEPVDKATPLTQDAIDKSVFNGPTQVFWSSHFGLIKKAMEANFVVDLNKSKVGIQTVANDRLVCSLKKLVDLDGDVKQQHVPASSSAASSSAASSSSSSTSLHQERNKKSTKSESDPKPVVIVRGVPGSGKSSLIRSAVSALSSDHPYIAVYDSDGNNGKGGWVLYTNGTHSGPLSGKDFGKVTLIFVDKNTPNVGSVKALLKSIPKSVDYIPIVFDGTQSVTFQQALDARKAQLDSGKGHGTVTKDTYSEVLCKFFLLYGTGDFGKLNWFTQKLGQGLLNTQSNVSIILDTLAQFKQNPSDFVCRFNGDPAGSASNPYFGLDVSGLVLKIHGVDSDDRPNFHITCLFGRDWTDLSRQIIALLLQMLDGTIQITGVWNMANGSQALVVDYPNAGDSHAIQHAIQVRGTTRLHITTKNGSGSNADTGINMTNGLGQVTLLDTPVPLGDYLISQYPMFGLLKNSCDVVVAASSL